MRGGVRRHRKHLVECDGLHQLLAIAGANISVRAVARWSRRERIEAVQWANAQITAYAKDKPGWRTSVFVPEHVSSANRGWRS